jgi:glycosyltransferase involved in cell wall biosynthesis
MKMTNIPFVSIIIPCRNEEKFIAPCLDSLIIQDYPKDCMEVLVIDGMSSDGTRNILDNYSRKYSYIKHLENFRKITPCAFNVGINNSKGDFVIIMGAHAAYDRKYVSKCINAALKYNADNVGGIVLAVSFGKSLISLAVAKVISSPFGAGNAYYKTSQPKMAREVDTVFGGCYRKDIFKKIGLFDERLARNQDMDFNIRLKKAGGKIMLVPGIISYYYPKPDLLGFAKHNFADGFSVVYPLKFGLKTFSWRHLLPLSFVVGCLGLLAMGMVNVLFLYLLTMAMGIYFLLDVFFSARIAFVEKNLLLFFPIFAAFFVRHFAYGLGSLWALIKMAV